jgi:hypothetical protein
MSSKFECNLGQDSEVFGEIAGKSDFSHAGSERLNRFGRLVLEQKGNRENREKAFSVFSVVFCSKFTVVS